MTASGPRHFAEAERLLALAPATDPVAEAQVYATLALVAATVQTNLSSVERRDLGWNEVLPTFVDGSDPIEELDLSVRAYNVLKREGVSTIDQLCELTQEELYDMRNMGFRTVDDVMARLQMRGRRLRNPHTDLERRTFR